MNFCLTNLVAKSFPGSVSFFLFFLMEALSLVQVSQADVCEYTFSLPVAKTQLVLSSPFLSVPQTLGEPPILNSTLMLLMKCTPLLKKPAQFGCSSRIWESYQLKKDSEFSCIENKGSAIIKEHPVLFGWKLFSRLGTNNW